MENQVVQQPTSYDFPTEVITLPSKGKLYPPDNPLSGGTIEMRYMTAKHEDILTNESYIKSGVVIDKLLEALIVSPVNLNDILVGDKNALLVAARILGYGKDYDFEYDGEKQSVDLSQIKDKELDESLLINGQNRFDFKANDKTTITFRLLTQGDEKNIDKELEGLKKLYGKNGLPEASTKLKHAIIAINGNEDPKYIRDFVDEQLLARDARALRSYIAKIQPDVDLVFDYITNDGVKEAQIPIGITFFWPEAGE